MFKFIRESKMPKWLKFIIYTILIVSVIYWLGYLIYKIVDFLRFFVNSVTDKKMFWVSVGVMIICGIVTLIILEYNTDVKLITDAWEWTKGVYETVKNKVIEWLPFV